ncbi:MAG TPA: ribosomal protein L7/L12 [Vicinamibacterales bacterium]|nr:ribosomal protein L7/L12 [Vicinamibacterales bacterium]HQZ38859.1 ribosomal protein L7/L12 [Vicinamibacterales bacterium]
MTDLSNYLTSLGVSPLLAGLVAGFLIGLMVRRRGPAGEEEPPATATLRTEFGGQPRITVTALGTPRELDGTRSAAVMSALDRNKKIDAIKLLREATGLGLKDAKDVAEALQQARARPPA